MRSLLSAIRLPRHNAQPSAIPVLAQRCVGRSPVPASRSVSAVLSARCARVALARQPSAGLKLWRHHSGAAQPRVAVTINGMALTHRDVIYGNAHIPTPAGPYPSDTYPFAIISLRI